MQTYPRLELKKGKEKPILQGHHWIYSGAVAKMPKELFAEVYSSEGQKLGIAFLSPGHSIAGHMLAFGSESIEEAISDRMDLAFSLRDALFDPKVTNAIRLINAEGDGIPGLIIDSYADHLVLQISHPGIDHLRALIVDLLIQKRNPKAILEKSTSFLRKKEGLEEARALLYGEMVSSVEVLENGLRFVVDLEKGQKTGLFLDQREMRSLVKEHAQGKKVLNGFAYTGGFSISALAGKAMHVDSVEISKRCKEPLEKNLEMNLLSSHRFIEQDMFRFLEEDPLDYDLVILDPPAFVKKREDIATAFRAYKELNRIAMSKMKKGSFLLTASCSYHVDEELFQNIIFRAALEAKRKVKILSRHRQALDHPVSLFHRESCYLKSLFLRIDS